VGAPTTGVQRHRGDPGTGGRRGGTVRTMALTHWTFVYVAPGLPDIGDVREVTSASSTTVLAGFPTAGAALQSCASGPLAAILDSTQLVELCGAFGHEHVAALRVARPDVPVGLVTYAGDQTTQLHDLFA
jgi:hypothetical protein